MVHYQRNLKKGVGYGEHEDEESPQRLGLVCAKISYYYNMKRAKPKFLYLIFLSLISCCFIVAPQILNSFGFEGEVLAHGTDSKAPLCSSVSNGTMCCDRSSFRSDICVMKGDIRTYFSSSRITLYTTKNINEVISHEKIKPYTRKWETSVMDTIDELDLVIKNHKHHHNHRRCDVHHTVPAVFFSTGGYTGNLYHEFNDGILPLFITSQHFNKRVVFVILEYHNWWITKYGNILSQLSDYPALDFRGDNKTHCFPEVIVGLRIHDELSVDSSLMDGNKNIMDFRKLIDRAYWPRIQGLIMEEEHVARSKMGNPAFSPLPNVFYGMAPKLVIVSRNGSRTLMNEELLIKMGEEIGFRVEVLRPAKTTELAKVYRLLNSSDVMVGVHGAAMTHLLFLKPKSVFIQIIPLGTDWAAETYYGEPAKKMGLKYIGYKILPKESSLFDEYDENDPVLKDPDSVNSKGWEITKKIYLDHQNVRLNLGRFRKRLLHGYYHSIAMRKGGQFGLHQSQ
ncbi:unnamed protein product [Cuscuta epithymum]|uniref:Glycosyltransferase 61 catalytic domain-containing protein n=1 Tax=Cuscuta epithymum TaxID=186058 RepID=A0AAV0CLS0_9ASTE|nr:unnamed protein product [Cuscuta epithymum]